MRAAQFIGLLPPATRKKLSEKTLARWCIVYQHVFTSGQTDRFDTDLQKKLGWPSEAAVQRMLKQMTEAGLLAAHRVLVKYTEMAKAFLGVGMNFALKRGGPPPGVFIRYTLPGMMPTGLNELPSKPPRGPIASHVKGK